MSKKRNKRASAAASSTGTEAAETTRVPLVSIWAVGLFLAAFSINAMPAGPAFTPGVTEYWIAGTLFIGVIAAGIAALPIARNLPARCAQLMSGPSNVAFGATVGVVTLILSVAAAAFSFKFRPIAADELAQLWHARMLARGWLSLPADPNPEFFAIDNVIDTGRWYSQYPIGGPAVLALGVLIGAPWLINPVLAAATSVAIYHFARNAYGEVEGRAIAALFAVSPMFVLMSGSHMNHVPVLFLMAVAMVGLVELDRGGHSERGGESALGRPMVITAVIGFSVGAMATIRPLDALVAAFVVGLFQLWLLPRRRLRPVELIVQCVTGTLAVIPMLIANKATTGSALRFGYNVMWGAAHQIGFHLDPMGTEHTPARAVIYAARYVSDLNIFAVMWPVPGLLLAIATLLMLRRVSRWDVFLLALFWVQVFAYALYWHKGQFIGPRFLFTALPAVIVLIARAPFLAGERFGDGSRRFAVATILLCLVASWTVPYKLLGTVGAAADLRLSRPLLKADVAGVARDSNVHNAVIFIREPFVYRLSRRLWGLGISRGNAAQLIEQADGCSVLSAIIAAESESLPPNPNRIESVAKASQLFVRGPENVPSGHPSLHFNSQASFNDACRAELQDDRKYGIGSFGPGLLSETITADGTLGGDIVYASDLGNSRNELLRRRFGNRTWYRLSVLRPNDETSNRVLITKY